MPATQHAKTFADAAIDLAREDGKPARKSIYLRPLQRLHRLCKVSSPLAVYDDVETVARPLVRSDVMGARALAAAGLATAVRPGADCVALAGAIGREVGGQLDISGNPLYAGRVRFSPPLPAALALASIEHSLLPGEVHVVYALTAYSCQQVIFMGPGLGRKYGNPDLGAFVELTSGKGVGHGKYDANRVNRARITPFGRRGGQPCT